MLLNDVNKNNKAEQYEQANHYLTTRSYNFKLL